MKHTKYYLALILILTASVFQNCGAPKSKGVDDTQPAPLDTNNKILGLYEIADVSSLKFVYTGGLYAQKPPEVTVRFVDGMPATAEIARFNQLGNFECGLDLNIPANIGNQIVSAAHEMKLIVVPTQTGVAVDCGELSVDISLKDSSSHVYLFQTVCSTPGQLHIADPQNLVGQQVSTLIGAVGSCPETVN